MEATQEDAHGLHQPAGVGPRGGAAALTLETSAEKQEVRGAPEYRLILQADPNIAYRLMLSTPTAESVGAWVAAWVADLVFLNLPLVRWSL